MDRNGIKILYEDENVVAIDKPAGLIVHNDGKTDELSVAGWVLERYPETKEVGEPMVVENGVEISRPGIVHRLDRDTSGVLLIAKTNESHASLKEQFQNQEVKKIYRAFVYGVVKNIEGEIDRPIARSKNNFKQWTAMRGKQGKEREAVTKYRVIKSGEGASYIEVEPKTGRTHQIRVHMKAINHPVVCDTLYAPNRECVLGLDRLALHSHKITFKGLDVKEIEVVSPIPQEFREAEALL